MDACEKSGSGPLGSVIPCAPLPPVATALSRFWIAIVEYGNLFLHSNIHTKVPSELMVAAMILFWSSSFVMTNVQAQSIHQGCNNAE